MTNLDEIRADLDEIDATWELRGQEFLIGERAELAGLVSTARDLLTLLAERDAQIAAVRELLDGAPMVPQAMVRKALDAKGGAS